mgnify:CR=1 FL=1
MVVRLHQQFNKWELMEGRLTNEKIFHPANR